MFLVILNCKQELCRDTIRDGCFIVFHWWNSFFNIFNRNKILSRFSVFQPLIFQLTQRLKKDDFEFKFQEKKYFSIGLSSTSMLLYFLDLFFYLSSLHKDQLILAVSGILSLKKFKTSKKLRSFLYLLTLIMKYEPYLGEKSFVTYGIISLLLGILLITWAINFLGDQELRSWIKIRL